MTGFAKIEHSSNIDAVKYDSAVRELEIKFKNGSHYAYFGVPGDVAEGLVTAKSAGSYFSAKIRGVYKHRVLKHG